jgi:hypothetical protein
MRGLIMAKRERDDLDEALDGRDRDSDRDDEDTESDDSDDHDDSDSDDADDDEEEERPADKRTKAELLAELERSQRALKRARRDARRNRSTQRRPANTRTDRDDDRDDSRTRRTSRRDDDRDDDRETSATAERKVTRARVERSQAKGESALLKAGADATLVELAVTKLGADDVDWTDEEDVSDWVDEMKDRYPSLFGKRKADNDDEEEERPRRRRAPSVDQDAGGRASGGRRREVRTGGFGASVIQAGRRADAPTTRRRGR